MVIDARTLELKTFDKRVYQEQGTTFLNIVRRAFLTDDPGLGKSIQAAKAAELPAMIICPKYLTGQWADFLAELDPGLVIGHADGTRTQRDIVLSKRADYYILNYQMVASYDLPSECRTYINDESHHLRNRTAGFSQAVKLLETDNPKSRVYNLTASPMWKTVADIWMQASILYPQVFTSYHDFVKTFCVSLNGPYGPKIVGIRRSSKTALSELLAPIMLGRTYEQVGRYLPRTIENIVRLRLPPIHQALYDKLEGEYSIRWGEPGEQRKLVFQASTVLHALRQITMHAGKVEAINGILEDNKNKPAIIGFWYVDHAKMMYDSMPKGSAVLCTGQIDATERYRLANWAQQNGKHIVASQDSLKEGANLSGFRVFIFGEEDYVPGSNHQFLSRAVRDRNDDGNDREPVRVYYVHARRTIDEVIHKTSVSRKNVINATRELLERTFKK